MNCPSSAILRVKFSSSVPYSQKIWQGIKFGGVAILFQTAKFNSTKMFAVHIGAYGS